MIKRTVFEDQSYNVAHALYLHSIYTYIKKPLVTIYIKHLASKGDTYVII